MISRYINFYLSSKIVDVAKKDLDLAVNILRPYNGRNIISNTIFEIANIVESDDLNTIINLFCSLGSATGEDGVYKIYKEKLDYINTIKVSDLLNCQENL